MELILFLIYLNKKLRKHRPKVNKRKRRIKGPAIVDRRVVRTSYETSYLILVCFSLASKFLCTSSKLSLIIPELSA